MTGHRTVGPDAIAGENLNPDSVYLRGVAERHHAGGFLDSLYKLQGVGRRFGTVCFEDINLWTFFKGYAGHFSPPYSCFADLASPDLISNGNNPKSAEL